MAEYRSRLCEHRNKALELLASKGFGQVGMRELASSLGLTPGSLYHHYPSKQHLLLDWIEEFYEELLTTLGRVEQRPRSRQDNLQRLIHAHLNLHREMPWHFRLVERDCGCLTEDQQLRVRQLREQYERRLLQMLGRPRRLSVHALQAAGHAIATLLNNAPSWLAGQALDDAERTELLENLLTGAIERVLAPRAGDRPNLQIAVA